MRYVTTKIYVMIRIKGMFVAVGVHLSRTLFYRSVCILTFVAQKSYHISNKNLFLSVYFSFISLIAEVNIVDAILNRLPERERSSVVKMLLACHP